MSKTINGKSLDEIMKELQADFPPEAIEKRDYDGIYYIGVDAYRERLNTVVGIAHYNELYDEVELVKAQDSYATKTKCRLEILDDDFNVIMVKESAGGSNIAFPKIDGPEKDDKGKPIKIPGTTTNSLPNDFDSACQDAFKRICKKQLLMGKRQLDNAKAGTPYTMTLTRPLNESNGHLFGEGKVNEKLYKLAIFKNKADEFKSAYGIPSNGQTIIFYGKEGKDNRQNDQIVFEKVCRSSTPPTQNQQATGMKNSVQSQNTSAPQNQTQQKQEEVPKNANQQSEQPTPAPLPQQERICITVDTELVNTTKSKDNFCIQGHNKSNEKINVLFYKDDYSKDLNWKNFSLFLREKPQGKQITFNGIKVKDNIYRCISLVA